MTQEIKDKLDYLIKLDKAYTECHWDYQRAFEYRDINGGKRYSQILRAIEKKDSEVWETIAKEYNVKGRWNLPKEIIEYYENGRNQNNYDRFNNYERDLSRLGVELP